MCMNLTFVLRQLLPLTILFLTLLDRLTFASLLSQSPRSLAWVGFHLLTVLSIVLVFGGDDWSRTSSAFRAADLQSTGVTNFPTSPMFGTR